MAESFLDTIYEKITDVIGGDNPNQYFCLSLPGTLVNPEEYSYDIQGEKPEHVKANESKLVNKLYDACFVAAADNGRHLQNQYRTALNMLSPKLNKELFELKIRLREILMTPFSYDFGDGMEDSMTLEQVFFRLYGEYVDAKAEWNQKQADKKEELKKIIDPNARRDAYLEWYGLVAEAENVKLEEKLGKVLNVFSPGDMSIINAILNCGVGGELESARSTLDMVEELNPDGGHVYPVNLYPRNWFELLDSSFTGVDLLDSPAALSQRLHLLEMQRSNILLNIKKLTSTLPSDEKLDKLQEAYQTAEGKFRELAEKCTTTNLSVSVDAVKSIISLCRKKGEDDVEAPGEAEAGRIVKKENSKEVSNEEITKMLDTIQSGAKECFECQAAAVSAAEDSAARALELCEQKNLSQLKPLLDPLYSQLKELNGQIEEVKGNIQISKAVAVDKEDNSNGSVMPNKETEGFTQVLIQSDMSSLATSSSRESSSSNSSWGVSFFFGGYSSSESHQQSVSNSISQGSEIDIQIGMNIAKVQIEREWFNPGVFLLTGNMYNFSDNRISPADQGASFTTGNTEDIVKRFNEMNKCIFPSYPVAFVIAKDVTIRFTSKSDMSSSFAESVEDHASRGGGFLIFSGSSSSASSSGKTESSTNCSADSITIRFTSPQIIGYYMEAVPEDKSVHINTKNDPDMSIIQFVSQFKQMIEEFNKAIRDSQESVKRIAGTDSAEPAEKTEKQEE